MVTPPLPPLDDCPVAVKPLEWIGLTCPTTIGIYRIKEVSGNFVLTYEAAFPAYYDSLDEARAAAQADYEQRILSALAPIDRAGAARGRGEDISTLRHLIDKFELWKCGSDADGYNVSADALAQIISEHRTGTKYYVDETGRDMLRTRPAIAKGIAALSRSVENDYAAPETMDELEANLHDRITTFRDMEPEEDETWESWYFASFDMLCEAFREIFEKARSGSTVAIGAEPNHAPVAAGSNEVPEAFVKFLKLVAKHFDNLPTGGEDMAHWANISNAECCRKIAYSIAADKAEIARLTAERDEWKRTAVEHRARFATSFGPEAVSSFERAEASESRCAALMAVLKPFHDWVAMMEVNGKPHHFKHWSDDLMVKDTVPLGFWRAAAAAYRAAIEAQERTA